MHTPGPWFFKPMTETSEEGGFYVFDDENSQVSNTLCTRFPWGKKSEEMYANGRLMAAAPELLKALEHCLRVLDNVYLDVMWNEGFPAIGLIKSRENGRAAIAKATVKTENQST